MSIPPVEEAASVCGERQKRYRAAGAGVTGVIIVVMTQRIGIAACSAEGAALCYRTICTEGAQLLGARTPIRRSRCTRLRSPLHELNLRGGLAGRGRPDARLWREAREGMGADFLICPDNTIHQALPYVMPRSPLPWLHIADAVMAEARRAASPRRSDRDEMAGWKGRSTRRSWCVRRGGARRDQPHHHGRAGMRRVQAGGDPVFSGRHGKNEARRAATRWCSAARRSRSS